MSCNANGQNGTLPARYARRHRRSTSPSQASSTTTAALASGQATQTGGGDSMVSRSPGCGSAPSTAAATRPARTWRSTHRPTRPSSCAPSRPLPVPFKVSEINTQGYDPSLFTRPARSICPRSARPREPGRIDCPAPAPRQRHCGSDSTGTATARKSRAAATDDRLRAALRPEAETQSLGSSSPTRTGDQQTAPMPSRSGRHAGDGRWAMPCGPLRPTEGTLILGQPLSSSITLRDGLYLAISRGQQRQ